MGAATLSLSPLKGRDEDTAKEQHAGSVEVRINNDRAPQTPGWGRYVCYWSENNRQTAKRRNSNRTWNIRSLRARCRWGILGLAKVRWTGFEKKKTSN